MMRSFGARTDTYVTDEPLYAHYLNETGLKHPGVDEILTSQDTNAERLTQWLGGSVPQEKKLWYQKHMTHHLLPTIDRAWMKSCVHCCLIRNPHEVLASYSKTRNEVTLDDLGFVQQAAIYDYVINELGQPCPVIDSNDILRDPEHILQSLCESIGIDFSTDMLQWESGLRPTDGVWAKYWYASVETSTGFMPYRERRPDYPEHLRSIAVQAEPYYETLYRARLR
jgi:hypothetical protein